MLVTLGVARRSCCASTTRRRWPGAAGARRARRVANDAPDGNDHGGRHRRTRVPGARDWRACCARAATTSSGSARGAASRRAWSRPQGIPVEWLSVSGLRGKGVADAAGGAVPARCGADAGAAAPCAGIGPASCSAPAASSSGPGGVAAWLTRRPLVVHEQNAVAGLTNRLLARLADRVLEGFPGSFGAGREGRARRQSGAPRDRRRRRRRSVATRAAKAACACWCSAAARAPRA